MAYYTYRYSRRINQYDSQTIAMLFSIALFFPISLVYCSIVLWLTGTILWRPQSRSDIIRRFSVTFTFWRKDVFFKILFYTLSLMRFLASLLSGLYHSLFILHLQIETLRVENLNHHERMLSNYFPDSPILYSDGDVAIWLWQMLFNYKKFPCALTMNIYLVVDLGIKYGRPYIY